MSGQILTDVLKTFDEFQVFQVYKDNGAVLVCWLMITKQGFIKPSLNTLQMMHTAGKFSLVFCMTPLFGK